MTAHGKLGGFARTSLENINEGINGFSKVGVLEWLYYVILENQSIDYVLWWGSESTPLSKVTGNVIVKCTLILLRSRSSLL